MRRFHPPAGVFQGVIGGPPCQIFSRLRYLNPKCGQLHGNMIPEFERVISEGQPDWFIMENVLEAPEPEVCDYIVYSVELNNRWLPTESGIGAEQNRVRRFSFGTRDGQMLEIEYAALEAPIKSLAITSNHSQVPVALVRDGTGQLRRKKRVLPPTILAEHGATPSRKGTQRQEYGIGELCRLQGLPEDFLSQSPFTMQGKRKVIGNGVPLPMGRAIAQAVRKAIERGNE